jgi:hypothetical protein
MTNQPPKCVHCERDSYEVPLVSLRYQDTEAWICPQHLPILIHKPQMLVGKLPGVENLVSEGHNHH